MPPTRVKATEKKGKKRSTRKKAKPSPEEKSGVTAVEVTPVDNLTGAVSRTFSDDRPLSAEEHRLLEVSLKSQRERLRVYEAVFAASRVARIQLLTNLQTVVEKELFKPARISFANTRDLVSIMKMLLEEKENCLSYIHTVANQDSLYSMLTMLFPDGSNASIEASTSLDTEDRRRVREILGRLNQAAKHGAKKD